jgi:hypothetical protein
VQSDIDPHQSHEDQVCLLSVSDVLRGSCREKFGLAARVLPAYVMILSSFVLGDSWWSFHVRFAARNVGTWFSIVKQAEGK